MNQNPKVDLKLASKNISQILNPKKKALTQKELNKKIRMEVSEMLGEL